MSVFFVLFQAGCNETKKDSSQTTLTTETSDDVKEQESSQIARMSKSAEKAEKSGKIPIIKVDNPVHNIGEVAPKSSSSCTFKFKNTGNDVLEIQRIQSTCGCTVPKLQKKEYQPGEEGEIRVTYKASSRPGNVSKKLYIHSNAGNEPRYELKISADTVIAVSYEPETLNLSLMEQGGDIKPIVITAKDNKPFKVTGFTDRNSAVSAQLSGNAATVKRIKPDVDVDKLSKNPRGRIEITLDHPETKKITIPYYAPPMYQLSSPRVIMKNATPGEVMDKEILLSGNYGKKPEIESVESEKGYMSVKDKQIEENGSIRMTVRVVAPEENTQRYFTDTMVVKLAGGEELQIRCSGWFKR